MTYHLSRKKTVKAGVVKVAQSQIGKALEEIDDTEMDRHEVVHQVRKRCKKMRGLIRLIRPAFPKYSEENAFFRDAAAKLSYVRDAQSIIECFDELVDYYQGQADDALFEPIRLQLTARREEVADNAVELEDRLQEFRASMVEGLDRVKAWKITEEGFDAVSGGLMKTYKRAQKAFPEAYDNPSTETFHEWRKRVKYHWYHTRLLRDIWPAMMKVHRQAADQLSDFLGDDHDLAVLKETLRTESKRFGDEEELAQIFELIDRRKSELQYQAQPLGEYLFAEKKKHLARRFNAYWMTWRR